MFMATMWVHYKNNSINLINPLVTISPHCFQSLLSIRQDDKVVCPRTKEVFNFSQAEKVYIMWWLRSVWVLTWSSLAPSFLTRGLVCSNKATRGAVIPKHFKSHHPPQLMINSRLPGLLPGLVWGHGWKEDFVQSFEQHELSELSLFYMPFLWRLETTEKTGRNPAQ